MTARHGWTGKIAVVHLSERTVSTLSTQDYSDRFIGGLGIGEKIYWDMCPPESGAFDSDNTLIMMTGPLCGTAAPSAPRLVVCGKSPCTYPERFVSASVAGFFPVELKKAGFDGIVLLGKADRPVYISIADGAVEIRDAGHLWGRTTSITRRRIGDELGTGPRIMTIGPGAENGARIGTLMIDLAGSASMGFGSVMGSKNLKAIAVKGSGTIPVADPAQIRQIRKKLKAMTGEGYYNIYGSPIPVPGTTVLKKVYCHGCPQGCWRTLQRSSSGAEGIRKCQTGTFYAKWDRQLHGEITEVTFRATELANDYSLCVLELLFIMLWLDRCFSKGLLTEEETGLPLSRMGSLEFFETMIQKLSSREGFGEVLSQGALRASALKGTESRAITAGFLNQTGRPTTYGPKSFIISAPVFAIEQRPSITELHEICNPLTKWALWYKTQGQGSYVSTEVLRGIAEAFWGGREAVDFSTYDHKAQACRLIQDRQNAKECLVLCDLVWPVHDDAGTEDHIGDPTLESRLLSAVTGRTVSEKELNLVGERVFNLNRAIQLREGRQGRQDDYLPDFCFVERVEPPSDIFDMYNPERLLPGKGDELVSHKGTAVDRERLAGLMDEYYLLRGWDAQTGMLTRAGLERLGLSDIIPELEKRHLLAA